MAGQMHGTDRVVFGHLEPMFPQLSAAVIQKSIQHPSNRDEPYDEYMLLQRCIDDLLELRTFTLDPAVIPAQPQPQPDVVEEVVVETGPLQPEHSVTEILTESEADSDHADVIDLSGSIHSGSPVLVGEGSSASQPLTLDDQDDEPIDLSNHGLDDSSSNELPAVSFLTSTPAPVKLLAAPQHSEESSSFVSEQVPSTHTVDVHASDISELKPNPKRKYDGLTSEPVNYMKPIDEAKIFQENQSDALGPVQSAPVNSQVSVTVSSQELVRPLFLRKITSASCLKAEPAPSTSTSDLQEDNRTRHPSNKRKMVMDQDDLSVLNNNKMQKRCHSCDGKKLHGDCLCDELTRAEEFVDEEFVDVRPHLLHRHPSKPKSNFSPVVPPMSIQDVPPPSWRAPQDKNPNILPLNKAVSATKSSTYVPTMQPVLHENKSLALPASASELLLAQESKPLFHPASANEQSLHEPLKNFRIIPMNPPEPTKTLSEHTAVGDKQSSTPLSQVSSVVESAMVVPPPEPVVKGPPTAEEILEERTERICKMFPLADPAYIKQQLKFAVHHDPEQVVCNNLLENPNFPKRQMPPKPVSDQSAASSNTVISPSPVAGTSKSSGSPKDYYKMHESSSTMQQYGEYYKQAVELLKNEFRKIALSDLRNISKHFKHCYAPTRKFIIETLQSEGCKIVPGTINVGLPDVPAKVAFCEIRYTFPVTAESPSSPRKITIKYDDNWRHEIKLLKCGRNKISLCLKLHQDLKAETEFILEKTRQDIEANDEQVAIELNEDQYEKEGQAIECGCCFGDFPFDTMVQCYEGHLFCQTCLQSYAKEAVFGQGKCTLTCMTDGCDARFPMSQLERALPSNVIAKYEERQQEEAINLADLEDLVRCPHCDFAALMDPSDKVFKCQNTTCLKETCRYCKEDWEEHFGKRCNEIEKQDETKLRLQFEERMTAAKIRTCYKCKASFTKTDGCNKMTCRCGARMCYICRVPVKDYSHFCNHPRDPGKGCTKCTNCSLWTNPEEDDERAVQEIKKEAAAVCKEKGFDESRQIGAPDDKVKNKKARKV